MLQAPWPPWPNFGVPTPAAESTGALFNRPTKTAKKDGLWWFMMVYDGWLWLIMVYYGLLWILRSSNLERFMVDCTNFLQSIAFLGPAPRRTWAGLVPKCCHCHDPNHQKSSAKAREVRNGAGLGSSTMANSYFRKVGGHNRATSEPILL